MSEIERNKVEDVDAIVEVVACCAALMGNYWQIVLVGLAAANLMMVGGWLGKAKAGWDA